MTLLFQLKRKKKIVDYECYFPLRAGERTNFYKLARILFQ